MKKSPIIGSSAIAYRWACERLKGYRQIVFDIGSGNGEGTLMLQKSGLKVVAIDRSSAAIEACDAKGVLAYCYSYGANSDPFQAPYAAVLINTLDEDHHPTGIVKHLAENADAVLFTISRPDYPKGAWEFLTPKPSILQDLAYPSRLLVEWRKPPA